MWGAFDSLLDQTPPRKRAPGLLAWALTAVLATCGAEVVASDEPVALELILAVDSSTSVGPWEYALQIDGLARAFRTPEVIAAVRQAGQRGIAVALVEWAGSGNQSLAVDWTVVRDDATGEAFAQKIEATARSFIGRGTALAEALAYMIPLFERNGLQGVRRVIDISGDGRDNRGADPAVPRDRALAAGITVNGLAILEDVPDLGRYYAERVAGGAGAFVMSAARYEDFAAAMVKKLLREITGAPLARAPAQRRTVHYLAAPVTETGACLGRPASCKGGPRHVISGPP
jgi:hypothetical protein